MRLVRHAPHNQADVTEHIHIITGEVYSAKVKSYVNSEECDTLFGHTRMPTVNFLGDHPHKFDMKKTAT